MTFCELRVGGQISSPRRCGWPPCWRAWPKTHTWSTSQVGTDGLTLASPVGVVQGRPSWRGPTVFGTAVWRSKAEATAGDTAKSRAHYISVTCTAGGSVHRSSALTQLYFCRQLIETMWCGQAGKEQKRRPSCIRPLTPSLRRRSHWRPGVTWPSWVHFFTARGAIL